MLAASQIASRIRTGRLLAVDIVAEALAAAQASQDSLNAFTLIDTEGAMTRARGIDMIVASGKDPGSLAGVPIVLKDLINQAGLPNTKGGSFPVEAEESSATVVRRLGAQGGVIIGRTLLHEFAFGFTSENHWFGPVRNPWNLGHSAGGSSGGSGAAVAAGIAPIGIGTDTGGSVRVPAALCGVFGLKVTHGRISLSGVYPLVPSLDTVGPIATNVADLALAYEAMAGDDPKDPWSQPVIVSPVERSVDLSKLRFGVVKQWNEQPQTGAVKVAVQKFLEHADSLGVDIVVVDEPALVVDESAAWADGPEVMAVHGERFDQNKDAYGPETRARIEDSKRGTVDDVLAAMRWRSQARAVVSRLTESGIDVLIAPTVGGMHKVIGQDDMDLDGEQVFHRTLLSAFTAPINQIGAPSIAAPITGTGTPPVSVQLIGARWNESTLLGIAMSLEAAGIISTQRPPNFFGEIPTRRIDAPHGA